MKIIRMQTQAFQRVVAVDITPPDGVVDVRGDNAEGKSSLLDSIRAAIGGAAEEPLKPVKTGEPFAAIRIELGDGKPELLVTKYFDDQGEKLRVETADGAEFKAGQTKLSDLLGRMTFDPLAFSRLKPGEQAAELRRLVPLAVDLDALAKADQADVTARRDVNRDAKALKARIDAIAVPAELPERPDREALADQMATAAETNTAIDRERMRRADMGREIAAAIDFAERQEAEAASLRERADMIERGAKEKRGDAAAWQKGFDALPPLDEPVDLVDLRQRLQHADIAVAVLAKADERAALVADFDALKVRSEAFGKSIANRAEQRAKALAEAVMPVEALSIARTCDVVPGNDSEELIAVYQGEPFAQASSAQQLRVSMQLAMSANPRLRVMLIKDGSLLDAKGFALIRELAAAGNYQVWIESVGEGDGTGFIMEAGKVRGAPDPEPLAGPKRLKRKVAEVEGAQQNETDGAAVAAVKTAIDTAIKDGVVAGMAGVADAAMTDKLTAQGFHHALPLTEADKLADFIVEERAKDEPAPAKRQRQRPAPLGGLFGGDE